jgi:hypothetical protein
MFSRPIELTEYYKWYVGFYPKLRPFIVFDPDHVEALAGEELSGFTVSASASWNDALAFEVVSWDLVDEGTTGEGNVTFEVDGHDSRVIAVSVSDEATAGTAVIRLIASISGVIYTGDLQVIVQ